jgi:hypothetical protein
MIAARLGVGSFADLEVAEVVRSWGEEVAEDEFT